VPAHAPPPAQAAAATVGVADPARSAPSGAKILPAAAEAGVPAAAPAATAGAGEPAEATSAAIGPAFVPIVPAGPDTVASDRRDSIATVGWTQDFAEPPGGANRTPGSSAPIAASPAAVKSADAAAAILSATAEAMPPAAEPGPAMRSDTPAAPPSMLNGGGPAVSAGPSAAPGSAAAGGFQNSASADHGAAGQEHPAAGHSAAAPAAQPNPFRLETIFVPGAASDAAAPTSHAEAGPAPGGMPQPLSADQTADITQSNANEPPRPVADVRVALGADRRLDVTLSAHSHEAAQRLQAEAPLLHGSLARLGAEVDMIRVELRAHSSANGSAADENRSFAQGSGTMAQMDFGQQGRSSRHAGFTDTPAPARGSDAWDQPSGPDSPGPAATQGKVDRYA
jgi:hypothetical protein